tara:strand:+ start:31 stop:252 length:222 start_codon:yes stop_codon:yes gene_type:complete
MSEWISVKDGLPDEPKEYTQLFVDVWVEDERVADVNFFKGDFHEIICDYQGDFSHYEKIIGVTYWLIQKPPKE